MKKIILSTVATVTMSTFAIAGGDILPVEPVVESPMVKESVSGFYAGIAMSDSGMDWQGAGGTYVQTTNWAPLVQLGYQFNEYISIEGRYQWDTTSLSGSTAGGYDVNVDYSNISLFVKPQYTIGNTDFTIYGLLGYGQVNLDLSTSILGLGTTSVSESGFQYGLGAEYALMGSNTSFFIDYTVQYDDTSSNAILGTGGNDDVKVDSWNFGIKYKF